VLRLWALPLASLPFPAIVYLANSLTVTLGFILVVFGRTQNDFALSVAIGDGKRLEHNIVSISRLVRERRADREPIVVLAFTSLMTVKARYAGCWFDIGHVLRC